MRHPSRRQVISALGLALTAGRPVSSFAQPAYPTKSVRVIVPFPAGTSPDVIARLWGDRFMRATGQAVVIDNRPGASTIIAAQAAAAAPADGYTLLWTVNNTFSINPFVYQKLPYKLDDFSPVTRILSVPYVLVVSAETRFRTFEELIQEARTKPGSLSYASAGIGGGLHVAMARLLNAAGVSMVHVPYKDYFGTDLIAQRVDVALDATTTALPQIRGGKYRALAVTSPKRIDALPDCPAIAETYPGFAGDSWQGIFVPKGTPDQISMSLAAQSRRIVESVDFRSALQGYGLTPVEDSMATFRQFLSEDARAWAKVVKDNAIKVE